MEGKKLLLKPIKDDDGSYGFRFQENSQHSTATIHVIGYENRTLTEYDWDGNKRNGENMYIFQYTLAGKGKIDIADQSLDLTSGEVFMVKVPSNHRYYLPKESDHWEFIYITLLGQEAEKLWDYVSQIYGSVVKIPLDSYIIQLLFTIYKETTDKKINDPYTASLKAYEFIMECYRHFKNISNTKKDVPENIEKAILYIHANYHRPALTIDEIAEKADLSKYYFIKKFSQHMNTSPFQYLTKVRIERAFDLLKDSNVTINEIAKQVGYANANYFNKVFRKIVGTSPGQFRQNKNSLPFDHLIID